MRLFATLTLLLLLVYPLTAFAEIPPGMKNDFAPLAGFIIMPVGDEFLVDLDASADLHEGDILTLVMPGEKVVHPVTKEILGTLDIARGYLQVSRIKSGYSYAKLLYSEVPPEKGDQVKRFEQVPTTFIAPSENTQLLKTLKSDLPQLNWLAENSSTEPLLTFELQNNLLTVKTANGTTLRSYQLIDGQLVAPAPRTTANRNFTVDADPARNKGVLNRTVNRLIDSIGLGKNDKGLPGEIGIIRNSQAMKNQNIWMSPNLAGEPTGLTVADLDNDGQLETLVAMRNSLHVYQIAGEQLTEEQKIELPAGTDILSIDVLDQNGDGTIEIYVTAVKDKSLVSRVLSFDGTEYQTVVDYVPWFLRVTELPGEGRVLIAQQSGDDKDPFKDKPFRLLFNGSELVKGDDLSFPSRVNLFSFLPLAGDTGGSLIAYVTPNDYLKVITESGEELWESGDYFGGTETRYYNTDDLDGDLINPVYIQKRLLRGPSGEILVVQNDGLRTLQRFRMFKNSRVIALNWNGFAMQETWRTSGQNGYLADFAVADADNDGTEELVMIVKFKHKTVLQDPRSAIIIYELK